MTKYTIDMVSSTFTENGCTLLTKEYKNMAQKLDYVCKCGETKKVSYQGFLNRKSGCKTCVNVPKPKIVKPKSAKRKITYDIVKKEFEDNDCTLISESYVNNRAPLEYICSCGEKNSKTYNCFQYKKGCMSCTGTPKYTYEQVVEIFKQKDCILLSKTYEKVGGVLSYICSCGNKSNISLTNLLSGHKCRSCRTYARVYTTEIVREEFDKYDYILQDVYVEYDTLMSYTCPYGHLGRISWRRFKNGNRCLDCSEVNQVVPASSSKDIGPELLEEKKSIALLQKAIISNDIGSELLEEMQKQFTEEEQVVFANNFYMYLNYHPTEDFVIDLGDVYEMIGFAEKGKAKRLMENNFTENEDYKILLHSLVEQKTPDNVLLARKGKQSSSDPRGGFNKESIMLNVDTFKNLCMIARTEKAKKIRMYYVKMENIKKLIEEKKSNVKASPSKSVLNLNGASSELLEEMKKQFTEEEQVVFANNFYMYLNYHPTEDFVIDLGNVYEMIGFSRIDKAKRTLDNNFTENEDYKITLLRGFNENPINDLLPFSGEQSSSDPRGGFNKESIMLNVDTFKNLCMIARTEKAKKIRMYYVKMENIKKLIEEKKSNVKASPSKSVLNLNGASSELLEEMKKQFTEEEQVVFANNFYMYLNYHPTEDFVIDLGNVYEIIGFAEKGKAKRLLENNFTENEDYKIVFAFSGKNSIGRPEQKIMLNVDTFKNLCMIARTDKAKKIRMYYVKLENINNELIKKSITSPILFNQDQINNSKRLIEHFGSKNDVFYMFSFKYLEELYVKFGIVGELREFHKRITEHQQEFGNICFHTVLQCSNVTKVEREFKETSLYSTNKAKIPKKSGVGSHVEIIKLSEIVTSEIVSQEMTRIAGNRILDPPPDYVESSTNLSLEMEKEKTKQLELQLQSQVRLAEIQMQVRLAELEIEKLKITRV